MVGNQQIGFWERVFPGRFGANRQAASGKGVSESFQSIQPATVALGRGELHVVTMSGACTLSCTEGTAWMTCPGRFCDYILKKGESLALQGEGKIIVSGGGGSCMVRICNQKGTGDR